MFFFTISCINTPQRFSIGFESGDLCLVWKRRVEIYWQNSSKQSVAVTVAVNVTVNVIVNVIVVFLYICVIRNHTRGTWLVRSGVINNQQNGGWRERECVCVYVCVSAGGEEGKNG